MNYSAKDHLSWLFRQHLIATGVIGISLGHVDPLLPRVVGAHVMVFLPYLLCRCCGHWLEN